MLRVVPEALYALSLAAVAEVEDRLADWHSALSAAMESGGHLGEIMALNRARAAAVLGPARSFEEKSRLIHEMVDDAIESASERWEETSPNVDLYDSWRDAWSERNDEAKFLIGVLEDVVRSKHSKATVSIITMLLCSARGASLITDTRLHFFTATSGDLRGWASDHRENEGSPDESADTSSEPESADDEPNEPARLEGTADGDSGIEFDFHAWDLDDLLAFLSNWCETTWGDGALSDVPFPRRFDESEP